MSWSTIAPGARKAPSEADRLLQALEAGTDPEEVFRRLYERFHRPVFACFSRRGLAAEDCQDLTQETFLRAFRGLARFRGQARFETWLYEIATNVWRNEIRRRSTSKRDGQEVSLDAGGEGDALEEGNGELGVRSTEKEPIEKLLAKEKMSLVQAELEKLPPRMRRCFKLRLEQELKFREIAALEQVSVDTVKSQLAQARKRVRTGLGEDLGKVIERRVEEVRP